MAPESFIVTKCESSGRVPNQVEDRLEFRAAKEHSSARGVTLF